MAQLPGPAPLDGCGPSRRARQHGFSLVEAMVAFLSVAFSILALFHVNAAALDASTQAKSRALALDLAEQKIEQLRQLRDPAVYAALANSTAPETIDHRYATFSRTWTAAKLTSAPRYAGIAVTVSWQDSDGVTQSVVLDTNIAEPDPENGTKWYVSALDEMRQNQAAASAQ